MENFNEYLFSLFAIFFIVVVVSIILNFYGFEKLKQRETILSNYCNYFNGFLEISRGTQNSYFCVVEDKNGYRYYAVFYNDEQFLEWVGE